MVPPKYINHIGQYIGLEIFLLCTQCFTSLFKEAFLNFTPRLLHCSLDSLILANFFWNSASGIKTPSGDTLLGMQKALPPPLVLILKGSLLHRVPGQQPVGTDTMVLFEKKKKMNTEWGKLNEKNCKKLMVGLNYN